MALADVHAHLTHPRLAGRADELVDRAVDRGVRTIIANGLHPADNQAIRTLVARRPEVRPAFGLYPVDAVLSEMLAAGVGYKAGRDAVPASEAVTWVRDHLAEAFAVGEIGLDGHWVPASLWARQEEVFREMIELAMEADKPIIVHSRRRERRAFEIVRELGASRVNWHCFGGKVKLAREIAAEPGQYMSIPANARRSESFTRMLQTLPHDRILLETDCPYLGPARDAGSEPADVAATAEYAAELWGVSAAELTRRQAENFATLFGAEP